MNSKSLLFLFTFFLLSSAIAQDTFSIVAVDSTTREVGSAGASCIDLIAANIVDPTFIGDLLPDSGAINSQAAYLPNNQINARARMRAGDSPKQIVQWLAANDVNGDSSVRQYVIAGFNGKQPSAAGYSGANCMNYKNHITGNIAGIYYTIAGNILLGQQILDSMEYKFRNAKGDLACRLMAGLQGAKVVGADTRCAPYGVSSLFAFLMVAQKTDNHGDPSYVVFVRTAANSKIEPIDTLQKKFTSQHSCIQKNASIASLSNEIQIYPNPCQGVLNVDLNAVEVNANPINFTLYNMLGEKITHRTLSNKNSLMDLSGLKKGVYFYRINLGDETVKNGMIHFE